MAKLTLITIGDELLRGRVVNTNAAEAGEFLQANGYQVSRSLVVPDRESAIRDALKEEWPRADALILCGGLGPTRDDITKKALADFAGVPLIWHQPTLQYLEKRYQQRNRELNALTRQQALYPEGFDVLPNEAGTAPGLATFENGRWLVALPGVPYEFNHLLHREVLPRLQSLFPAEPVLKAVLRMEGLPESDIAARIASLEPDFPPGFYISYLPRLDGMWLELIFPGGDLASLAQIQRDVAALFPMEVYARTDAPLASLLAEALQRQGFTLAVAESLTAGRLAALIAEVSGASAYFEGGLTAYSNRIKQDWLGISADLLHEKGSVSEEIALAMASGIRRAAGSDIGVATTGYAEQAGNIPPQAWIAAVGPGFKSARRIQLYADRTTNIERTAAQALTLVLRALTPSGG